MTAGTIKQNASRRLPLEAGYNAPSAKIEVTRLPTSSAPATSHGPMSSANIMCIRIRLMPGLGGAAPVASGV